MGMDMDGLRARELAQAWWESDTGARARERGSAVCDRCNARIAPGEGFLVSPVGGGVDGPPDSQLSMPELACDACFSRKNLKAWNPDASGVLGRPYTPATKLYPPSPKRRRWFAGR
jgi:hypothetical protein